MSGKTANPFKKRLVAILIFLGSLCLYIRTMAPSVVLGDSGEFQFVPYILGIAHPTGYPFFTLVGKLFSFLPVGSIAYRMNLLAAFCGALTVTLVYLMILELIPKSSFNLPAVIGAAFLATSPDLWQHSIHANAHIITAVLAALSLFFLLRWSNSGKDSLLYAFSFVCGVVPTHHPLLVFAFPSYALFAFFVKPNLLRSAKKLTLLSLAFLTGLSFYLYLPIRSATAPPFGPSDLHTLDGFLRVITARGLRMNIFHFGLEELPRRLWEMKTILFLQYDPLSILLGLVGLVWLLIKERKAFALLFTYSALTVLVTINIFHDALSYLLGPFVAHSVLIGVGASHLFKLWGRWGPRGKAVGKMALALILLAFPIRRGIWCFPRIDMSGNRIADEFVNDVFDYFGGKGEGAFLLCNWENIAPLWYYKFVEGRWPDERDVRPFFVSADIHWADAVWSHIGKGPVYLYDYRREVVEAGFRLLPVRRFYKVLREPLFEMPRIQHRINVTFGEKITLLGYDLDKESVKVGETLRLTIYLQASEKLEEYYMPFFRLINWYRFTTDSRFLSPFWEPGEVVAERYDIVVPFGVEPGEYPLEVGISSLSRGEDLLTPDGHTTLKLTRVEVEEGKVEAPLEAIEKALANFGSKILLVGAEVRAGGEKVTVPWADPPCVRPGDRIQVTLYWRALQRVEEGYTVFVHVIDGNNRIWGQKDSIPLSGSYPIFYFIPRWLPDQVVADRYEFHIDPNAPPGDYWIEVGMYGMETIKRLPIFDKGFNLAGDRVILGRIRIEPHSVK